MRALGCFQLFCLPGLVKVFIVSNHFTKNNLIILYNGRIDYLLEENAYGISR